MGILEAVLICIGVALVLASFFITEKLSPKEVEEISKLSESELKVMVEKKLFEAESKIDDALQSKVEESVSDTERKLEKETNEKIMHINEYSDTVLESINKTHNEVMFLYSMLNDKYDELTTYANELTNLKTEMEEANLKATEILSNSNKEPEIEVIDETPKNVSLKDYTFEDVEMQNHNDMILEAYKNGLSEIEIARQLGLGIGEVRLVLDLYKGELSR